MKKKQVITITSISLVFIFIFLLILVYLNASILGDLFSNNFNNNKFAVLFYKIDYERSKNNSVLAKLCNCLWMEENYNDGAKYFSKIVKEDSYLKAGGNKFSDINKTRYVLCLYYTGNKGEFRRYLENNINSFDDKLNLIYHVSFSVFEYSNSSVEDYRFILEKCTNLLSNSDKYNNIDESIIILNICTITKNLYLKLGDNIGANKYEKMRESLKEKYNK